MNLPHVVHQVPSMSHIKGPTVKAHQGSQSHEGSSGTQFNFAGHGGMVGKK